jgi:nucleotide sugar dehydrogenase
VGKVKNKAKMAKKTIERDFGELEKKIRDGSARVAFIGLGKMGLPSALAMAEAGFSVVGVDVNESVVEKINRGESPYLEPGTREALRRVKKRGRFRATTRYSEIKGADVVLCAVPTLITRDKRVDYSIVEKAFREAGKHLKRGSLVVFESNVTPGVTEGLVRESIEKNGLKHGKDFLLAYVPIQGKAGRMFRDLRAYERVVAGVTPRARELAALFFKRCGFKTLLASSCKVAELEKLYANIYKDVTIAAANELADYCDALGIDVREVIRFARLIPGINIPEPGIGVGGNCLPVDPYFLIHDGRRVGVDAKLARAAREVNDGRAAATARKIIEIAAASKATRVVLLGAAFRPDTHETAYSPALEVYARVAARFPQTRVFDPLVGSEALARLGVREASDRDLRAAELVFELVPHSAFEKPKGLLGKRVGKRIIRLGDLV